MHESITAAKIDRLRDAIRDLMTPDAHLGDPHACTVEAITQGVVHRVQVSQSRPARYGHEPWVGQDVREHLQHAHQHAGAGMMHAFGDDAYSWLSDLGCPEIAHAGLRIDFALHLFPPTTQEIAPCTQRSGQ